MLKIPSASTANTWNAETFAPMILRRLTKAQSSRRESPLLVNSSKTRGSSIEELVTVVLARPLRMFSEPLVFFTDLFLLYEYTIFYLNFESYPIIFKGL